MADFLQNNGFWRLPLRMTKKKALKKSKTEVKKEVPKEEPEKDERFDFGGLPHRNLKKNLGCG